MHVGCGSALLPDWFKGFQETRLDVNEAYGPDVVADMLDMGEIGDFDVVYCAHALEHVYPHEADRAAREFLRVLKPGGYAMVFVPDLEGVKPTDEILFDAPSGPIAGLDLIYGYRIALEQFPRMAHRNGFTSESLAKTLRDAGFSKVETRRLHPYNLMAVAVK